MKRLTVAVIMWLICFMFTACGGDSDSGIAIPKKIVFMGIPTGSTNGDIYIMNEDGSDITNITNTSNVNELNPAWSPDGTKIYFIRVENSKYYLYVMNIDGSNTFKITTTQSVRNYYDYMISPDGTQIIFCGDDGSDNEVFRINNDGTGLINLTNNNAQDVCPSWRPMGGRIAFLSNRDGGNYGLYVMKNDGTEQERIENYDDVKEPYTPQWSPDGHNIAFVRYGNYLNNDNYEIFVKGNTFLNISQNNRNDYYPLWSPDGKKIAFASERDGNFNIYLWSTTNTVPQRLTDSSAKDAQHCWSPDGSKIVFISERDVAGRGQIYVMNADGSNQTRIFFDSTLNCMLPKWQP